MHCENHLDQKNCTFGLLFALLARTESCYIVFENCTKMVSFEFFWDFCFYFYGAVENWREKGLKIRFHGISNEERKSSRQESADAVKLDFFEDVY